MCVCVSVYVSMCMRVCVCVYVYVCVCTSWILWRLLSLAGRNPRGGPASGTRVSDFRCGVSVFGCRV